METTKVNLQKRPKLTLNNLPIGTAFTCGEHNISYMLVSTNHLVRVLNLSSGKFVDAGREREMEDIRVIKNITCSYD